MKKISFAVGLIFTMVFSFSVSAMAANVTLSWDAVTGAAGYKVYMSTDNGTTWGATPKDTGPLTPDARNMVSYVYPAVPDAGLVMFKMSAYDAKSETRNDWAGAWYNGTWKPVAAPVGGGIR